MRTRHSQLTLNDRLEALGLEKNQAYVYLAALEHGEATIGDLQRTTGLHKQLIYDAADRLQAAGLLNISQVRGRRRFAAMDPAAFEAQIKQRMQAVQGLLPALYQVASTRQGREIVRTYTGVNALRQFYLRAMRTQPEKKTVRLIATGGQKFFEIWGDQSTAFHKFEKTRLERSIPLQMIFFVTQLAQFAALPGVKGRTRITAKAIVGQSQAPLDVVLWHNHVSLLIYGVQPTIIDVINPSTVQGFSTYFKALWEQATDVE